MFVETLLPSGIAEELGLAITAEQVELAGFSGQKEVGRVSAVEIGIPALDLKMSSRVVVLPEQQLKMPILGHSDFFSQMWVGFDTANHAFYLARARVR